MATIAGQEDQLWQSSCIGTMQLIKTGNQLKCDSSIKSFVSICVHVTAFEDITPQTIIIS